MYKDKSNKDFNHKLMIWDISAFSEAILDLGKCPMMPQGHHANPHSAWLPLSEKTINTWWCHQLETFSALPALCEGNTAVTSGFPPEGPVTQSFDVFFDLRLYKRLGKQQSRHWWFETPSWSLWRHCNGLGYFCKVTKLAAGLDIHC